MADNHGDILGVPQSIKTIKENREDIFEKGSEKSTYNVLAHAGDYFMNPDKRGLLTNPQFSLGDIQYNFFLKLIYDTRKACGNNGNFETIYEPGNHCFGAGDEWLFKKLSRAPMTTLVTNTDLRHSPLLSTLMEENNNIVKSKIVEIPDSKNPDIKSHTLFLGITIPSKYYNPENIKYTHFYDETNKNDASIKENDLRKTIRVLKYHTKLFKGQYPDGAIVILSHTGNNISKMIAEKIPEINLILNGHDHKDFSTIVGNTLILSHGQNNQFLRGIKLVFNDDGKLSFIRDTKYDTEPYSQMARQDKNLQNFVQIVLKKDLEPLVYFKEDSGKSEEMILTNAIRYKNNVLANYVTSAIKTAAKEKYPNLDAVGIPSTIFRNGLKSNLKRSTFNNIDLLDMFKGADENVAGLRIGSITGDEIVKLITENVKNNLKSKTRNALIQWSDFQINKTLISDIANGRSKSDYSDAIKFKNPKTGEFEPIDPFKGYCILMSDKYLIKNTLKMPQKIRDKFVKIDENYDTLFKRYLDIINRDVKITDEYREQRII